MEAVKKPCPACPFTKTVQPGALGGSTPEAFIGQVRGPFTLPCHAHCNFDDPEWRSKAQGTPQCAGAAAFRTHIGVAGRMPAAIPILPANPDVFADEYEFLAHHTGIPAGAWKLCYSQENFDSMMLHQMRKAARGEKP